MLDAARILVVVDNTAVKVTPGIRGTAQLPPEAGRRVGVSGDADGPSVPRSSWAARYRWIAGVVLLLVAAPVVWYGATQPLATAGSAVQSGGGVAKGIAPLLDHEAPNFKLRDAGGGNVELKQFRGRSVLLNFWATWCAPCREEMPEMEQFYRQYKDTAGLVVLAVSIDTEGAAKDVPAYLKEGDPKVGSYTFPVALDTRQEVAKLYRLGGVPSSFFIDTSGVIRAVQPGVMNRQLMLDRLRTILPTLAS